MEIWVDGGCETPECSPDFAPGRGRRHAEHVERAVQRRGRFVRGLGLAIAGPGPPVEESFRRQGYMTLVSPRLGMEPDIRILEPEERVETELELAGKGIADAVRPHQTLPNQDLTGQLAGMLCQYTGEGLVLAGSQVPGGKKHVTKQRNRNRCSNVGDHPFPDRNLVHSPQIGAVAADEIEPSGHPGPEQRSQKITKGGSV